ncbi:hypothetical protein ACSBR2_021946 [Camellia fascicularis]
MCVRSAEVANQKHLEGVKKIAKLEKLPGPAALAQMKLEAENLGRDYRETRVRRSPLKPPSPHPPQLPDFSLDSVPKFYKENDFLTERLLAMKEETKMLKKALAMCTSELQASRNICAKTVSKLQILESQLHANNQQKSPSKSSLQIPTEGSLIQNAISPPSFTSMSEDGNDNERSCAGSWATTSISELSHFKGKNIEKSNKAENENHLELMDVFLEMEKLASNDSNGAISGSDISNNMRSEMANQDTTINPHFHPKNSGTSPDGDVLSQKIQKFFATFDKVINSKISLLDFVLDLSCVLIKVSERHFNVLGYKNNEAETNCSYCIDKVALPENKVVRDTSGDRYSNGCAHFSDSASDHEGSFISTFESNATTWKCLLEEFEQLKLEKDNMALDLESTKAQLQGTEQLLAEVKSQLASAQKLNSLAAEMYGRIIQVS